MKRILQKKIQIVLWTMLMLFGTLTLTAQTSTPLNGPDVPPTPKVVVDCKIEPAKCILVDPSFIADSAKAFTEVTALRDAVQKFLVERAKTDAEKEGAKILITSLNDAIAVRDKIHDANLQLITIYDKIIKIQNDIIDKLTNQLNKPKGFFSKLLNKIKEVALLATGIILGRGL